MISPSEIFWRGFVSTSSCCTIVLTSCLVLWQGLFNSGVIFFVWAQKILSFMEHLSLQFDVKIVTYMWRISLTEPTLISLNASSGHVLNQSQPRHNGCLSGEKKHASPLKMASLPRYTRWRIAIKTFSVCFSVLSPSPKSVRSIDSSVYKTLVAEWRNICLHRVRVI